MVITKTPYRISFFGGGSDYPSWYRENGGMVLGVGIDKFCYISCRNLPPFFEHTIRLVYSQIELCKDVAAIEHPAVRGMLEYMNIAKGIEIHHDGDLPARSGMGSSSSFVVGLYHALLGARGESIQTKNLAEKAIYIEQNVLKEQVGSQDQILAAYGGFQFVEFFKDSSFTVSPVKISKEREKVFHEHLLLFYTGVKRDGTASDLVTKYISNFDQKEKNIKLIQAMAQHGLEILQSNQDLIAFGELLNEAWQIKRDISGGISNLEIDRIYESALASGAIGGKLLGAGGGGFMLLFVKPENKDKVKERLKSLIHIPFQFDYSGSRIIFNDLTAKEPS